MSRTAVPTLLVILAALALPPAVRPQSADPPRGFLAGQWEEQRQIEERFRAIPDPARLREYMEYMSAEPHIGGFGHGSKRVADYALEKFLSFGLDAAIEETEALMPLPVDRHVEVLGPEPYTMRLAELGIPEDKDSSDPGQLPTFNPYAADGDVTGEVVFVNYGIPEDYEKLAELGISVEGKIVLARYGRSWRGIKAKLAQENGALGALLYSDPEEDGYYQGLTYPEGPYRPKWGVQRGSIMDMPVHPGDPLTPGWGAKEDREKLTRETARTLVKIPVLPISWGDALPILEQLRGTASPNDDWKGALPITYHIGPGPVTVRMRTAYDWQVRPIYNVVARIEGSTYPDEWIVHGNHHDAWCNGATDPISGAVQLMETARGFGELLQAGIRPRRTVVFALWDAEEWGLLGSTEWAETHRADLGEKGVTYINTDSTGKGWLSMAGSHTLQRFLNEVARDIEDPERGVSVFEAARARRLETAANPDARREIEQSDDLRLAALGSGSDYTVFIDHLTMASLNLGFGGDSPGGVYHSNYDSLHWYQKFSDSEYVFGRTLSRLVGTAMWRLANAAILPFGFTDLADAMATYVEEIRETHAAMESPEEIDFEALEGALAALREAGQGYEDALSGLTDASAEAVLGNARVSELNQLLYTSERRLGSDEGLPNREWFRHQVYAPGFYTGYGVKTIPGVREGIEEEEWEAARFYVRVVSEALSSLTDQVREAERIVASLR
ncbi:MAG: M28 family peptidase [Gammaproteobacteria bacterium]|nr:M28 family peptidase [Gammaproteobacteria bacterium]